MRDYALVFATDAPDPGTVLRLARKVMAVVDGVKIGVAPLLRGSVGLIQQIKQVIGKPVIADLKVADIGLAAARGGGKRRAWVGTNSAILATVINAGADYVTCHGVVGSSSLRECVDTAHSLGGKVLTLPYMTHEGAGLFFDQPVDLPSTLRYLETIGSDRAVRRLSRLHAQKLRERGWRLRHVSVSDLILVLGDIYGVDGYIGPANRPAVLKDYRRLTNKEIFATGIGRQGGVIEGVYSLVGPKCAAIVGHTISAAQNPVEAARRLTTIRDQFALSTRKAV